jgi:hypothetical protein
MDYRPYSPEWHRKRYLKEALDKYFDDYYKKYYHVVKLIASLKNEE